MPSDIDDDDEPPVSHAIANDDEFMKAHAVAVQ